MRRSLLSPQIGDRLQRRMLGEFLCMQHSKGWLCKWGLPRCWWAPHWGQSRAPSTPIVGGTRGHRCSIRRGPT